MKSVIKIVFSIFFSFLVLGCTKKTDNQTVEGAFELQIKKSPLDFIEDYSWKISQKKVCIVLGYGYQEKDFKDSLSDLLKKKFGLADEGGLVKFFCYPDDFKVKGRPRITALVNLLEETDLQGLIFLGAPENSHNAILSLAKAYDGVLPFPVFSFLPQDDVLGMEYTCDFVLEKAAKANLLEVAEEETGDTEDVTDLLASAVYYMTLLDEPLGKNPELLFHVQKIAGKIGRISRYVDVESSLQSVNHFVLNRNE